MYELLVQASVALIEPMREVGVLVERRCPVGFSLPLDVTSRNRGVSIGADSPLTTAEAPANAVAATRPFDRAPTATFVRRRPECVWNWNQRERIMPQPGAAPP
jgi:hypothetical protein